MRCLFVFCVQSYFCEPMFHGSISMVTNQIRLSAYLGFLFSLIAKTYFVQLRIRFPNVLRHVILILFRLHNVRTWKEYVAKLQKLKVC